MTSLSTTLILAIVGMHSVSSVGAVPDFEARTISSRPETVSGGDVLVQLSAPARSEWVAQLNGRDVSSFFRPTEGSGGPIALLTGLELGSNTLEIRVNGKIRSTLRIRNYPVIGPIFSGPHQEPFVCQTVVNGLGPVLDAHCSANTVVQYYYKSTSSENERLQEAAPVALGPGFKVYDLNGPTPSDVARTVTSEGRAVNFIVRRERGTINRAVYEIQFLHQPGEPLPSPWTVPNPGWNGRLVYTFGAGCAAGYRQGILPENIWANPLPLLALGYASATSTLNIFGVNCNDRLSAETLSMVREYFIEHYGNPVHTIGRGGSGGAMQQYLIAQNHPDLLDGIVVASSFPDFLTYLPPATDCPLLRHAFKTSKEHWSEEQKTAVSGFATWRRCGTWKILDPRNCDASMPKEIIYHRITNPRGVRCDIYSNLVNTLGRDPKTGLVRRPLDNVGVQYGLLAFNSGRIDAEQFVDLNERIGGYDEDGDIVPIRMEADPEVLRIVYEQGSVLRGGGSLSRIPIVDEHFYVDDQGDEHDLVRAFQVRSRLIAANGSAKNQAILVSGPLSYGRISDPEDPNTLVIVQGGRDRVRQMDQWLDNIAADSAAGTVLTKIARNRPAELAEGCWQVDGNRIIEPASYDGSGRCHDLYPPHGDPRLAAGAPVSGDILKCVLKPIDPADYGHPLNGSQLKRLRATFPAGVCDFSRPGVGQNPTNSAEGTLNSFPSGGKLEGGVAANATSHGNELRSVNERLKDPRPIVGAHRSCWQFGPENSLKAIKACTDLGVDAAEGDIRTTKDGVVVLFHDETLDRMTNASGPLKNYTYPELKNVRLRNGAGGKDAPLTDERIPTLEDALILAKNRLFILLDVTKEPNYNQAFDVVAAQGAEDRVIFVLDAAAGSAELQNARFLGKSAYMPVIRQCGWEGRQRDCYEHFSEAVADYQQFNPVAYVAFANPGFGSPGAGGGQSEAAWSRAIAEGKRFIGTDHPVQLLQYLKSRGLR